VSRPRTKRKICSDNYTLSASSTVELNENSPTGIRRHPDRDQFCVARVVHSAVKPLFYSTGTLHRTQIKTCCYLPSANSRLTLQYSMFTSQMDDSLIAWFTSQRDESLPDTRQDPECFPCLVLGTFRGLTQAPSPETHRCLTCSGYRLLYMNELVDLRAAPTTSIVSTLVVSTKCD
jgi:hypothetical protein